MKNYGLIGGNLVHSFSKSFFENYFTINKIEATYNNIELIKLININEVLSHGYHGLNITIPFKEKIIPFLDDLSDEARIIRAVNTIQFQDGRTIGHNTDVFGFHQSVKPFIGNKHERAIIIGTGGASKAVEFVLKSIGIDVIFISRNPANRNEFSYKEINLHMLEAHKMIVNCTPIGTFPNVNEEIDLPYHFISEHHLVVDLIYNPSKTVFLKKAEKQGAMIMNGYSMLREQALKSWSIWNR